MSSPNDEGFRARLKGETIHQNPYAPMTKEHSEWQEGWKDQDEHLNARDEALASIGWFG
jgi:hypothetical protein